MNKITHSSSSFTIKLLLIVLCLCASSICVNVFKTYPDYKIYIGNTYYSTAVKISSDQRYIAVGFTNGTVYVYNSTGSYQFGMYAHNYTIIDIQYIYGGGWVTLDYYGKACRWSSGGSLQYTWNFTTYPIDMTITDSYSSNSYIAFNFGSYILEYYIFTTNTTSQVYYPQSYTRFVKIQYGQGYYRLYAASNTSYVYQYSTSTGAYTGYSVYTSYDVKAFDTISTGDIAVLNNWYVYTFSSSMSYTYFSYSGTANSFSTITKDSQVYYILANVNSSSTLTVVDVNGYVKQNLTYLTYTARAIDTSRKYLVSVDSGGYLSINTFATQDDSIVINVDFPGWAIALIVSFVLVIILIIVAVAIVRVRKRKLALAGLNGYNQFNSGEPQISAQYFPNNQGYNPTNPTNPTYPPGPANQGWNNNQGQGWNGNQGQGGYYPPPPIPSSQQGSSQPVQPINPYQGNQPSAWS